MLRHNDSKLLLIPSTLSIDAARKYKPDNHWLGTDLLAVEEIEVLKSSGL